MLIIVLAPLNVYFLGHLNEMKKIIFESNVQMKKWFVCMQGQQCPRSQGHGQEEGRRNQCCCLALTEPHLDIAQLGALQHRHNHEPESPKGTGAGAAALGGRLQEQGWLRWAQRHWGTLHPFRSQ